MKLTNTQLQNFINRIKLKQEYMPKYREQIGNLKDRLEAKIKDDKRTGIKVTKFLIAGSWKKGTILKPTGENPIDIDLVLFVEGDESLKDDLNKLHDFIVEYLEEIYPQKDINRDVDAEGNTKSITIRFSGTGLEVDIVPVVPMASPKEYVWQPQRGGGGKKYVTSVTKQLDFAKDRKNKNPSLTSIVRAIKWWRNYKELNTTNDETGLSSYTIELIVSYLDFKKGIEQNIEEGIIRFFQFISTSGFPIIKFADAINSVPTFDTPIFVADSTNNENNAAKKINAAIWKEIIQEAEDAFDSLNIAQYKNFEGDTVDEWKRVFGPTFNISELD
ncbi:MAG: nucleotidyltransferase [Chitinophagales bacterium]|nr:nucleotidyltransferase [Chitinophagales bacterium]